MSNCQENIEDETTAATKNPFGDVLLSMTTVATATVGMFFSLRSMCVGQHNSMLTSTSLAWLLSRPI